MTTTRHSFRDYVNFRLERVARTAREAADEVYQRRCGLDILHIRVLRIVAEPPGRTVNSVVCESFLDRSQVSRIVSNLVRQKLLNRTISPTDARQFLLALTPAGQQRVNKANVIGDKLNLDLLNVLDEREIEVLDQCLSKLARWRPNNEGMLSEKARGRRRILDLHQPNKPQTPRG
jgi:MarR family transcriptional regulator, temperature-dependent positive regulator of motility